ncbi:MAG: hypothetical protein A4E28_01038 [Methanocella sp. PtaU1.Bin125]|nr:MAG: hypothetical protein A4E28_01038 [Methanocella sp. PtaU1.Bin125]
MLKKTVIIVTLAVAVMILFLLLPCGMSLIVRDNAGYVYFEKDVSPGDVVSLEFKHSVEKVQVVDTFLVMSDGTMFLTNSTYGSMGAGLASDESYNITTDASGNFSIENINVTFESIPFITGKIPMHHLKVNNDKYPIYRSVPDGKPLFLIIERNNVASKLF